MATPPLPSKSPKAQKSAFGEKVVYRWGADIVAAVEAGVQAEQHARIRAISFAAAQSAIDRLEASGGPRASESEVLLQAVRDALADAGIRADDLTERTFGTSREPTPGWLLEGLGGSSPHPPRDGVASRWLIVEPPAESPHALTVVPAAAFVAAETPKALNSPWLLSESSTPAPAPREPTVAPRGADLAEKWAPRPVVAAAAAGAAVGGTAPPRRAGRPWKTIALVVTGATAATAVIIVLALDGGNDPAPAPAPRAAPSAVVTPAPRADAAVIRTVNRAVRRGDLRVTAILTTRAGRLVGHTARGSVTPTPTVAAPPTTQSTSIVETAPQPTPVYTVAPRAIATAPVATAAPTVTAEPVTTSAPQSDTQGDPPRSRLTDRMKLTIGAVCAAASVALTTAMAAAAGAAPPATTLRVSSPTEDGTAIGFSTRPTIDAAGRRVAFESADADPGGTHNVYERNLATGVTALLSAGAGGTPPDGPSVAPVISGNGRSVVFTSGATNLTGTPDANGANDVFLYRGGGSLELVTAAGDGTSADGSSGQPDISADGNTVVFTSVATNLTGAAVSSAITNVYARNLRTGRTVLVSRAPRGTAADGPSAAPAVSPDGRFVSFYSLAHNLVKHDTNRIGDVFLADLATGKLTRVTLSGRGRQQNHAVAPPFQQISDVSRDGRLVTFDSDATNLVRGDTNRDTDVFVRDVRTHTTQLVSRAMATNVEGDNDSFYPRISPSGRFIAFDSFAGNLYPGAAKGENVYVRDQVRDATSLMSVTAAGKPRGREHVRELLQRPDLAADGSVVALTSTAPLSAADDDTSEDVYARRTTAPTVSIRLQGDAYRLRSSPPGANVFRCAVPAISGFKGGCDQGASIAFLAQSTHRHTVTFRASAVAPGTLIGPVAARRVNLDAYRLRR